METDSVSSPTLLQALIRFQADWEGIWHSFVLPILGSLPSKCVVRIYYFVESATVKGDGVGRIMIQGL